MSNLIIVLVEPKLPENIGMCARAMRNCGISSLRLVEPRADHLHTQAVATASGAANVLQEAGVFLSVEDAIADCHHVLATTARDRSDDLPVWSAEKAGTQMEEFRSSGEQVAVLFGTESNGLDADAISRAEALVRFPTDPDFPSLNLAQAVLLLGWEWNRARRACAEDEDSEKPQPEGERNERKDLLAFQQRLESLLETSGFFLTEDLKPSTLRSLRGFFSRANPTERELRMLHGVVTALAKLDPESS